MLEQSLKAVANGKDPFGILREADGEDLIFFDSDKNFSDIDKDYSCATLAVQGALKQPKRGCTVNTRP